MNDYTIMGARFFIEALYCFRDYIRISRQTITMQQILQTLRQSLSNFIPVELFLLRFQSTNSDMAEDL